MKTGKLITALLALFGVLLIGGAAIVRLAVAPSLMKLSYESDGDGLYIGALITPNPDPAAAGEMLSVPVEANVNTEVKAVSGDVAVVETRSEIFSVPRTSDQGPLVADQHTYAIDRQDYLQAPPPDGVTVDDQKGGITISFPPDPDHTELAVYDSATQEAQPLAFAGTVLVDGHTLDKFKVDSTAAVKDPAVLQPLRTGLGQKFGTDGTWVPKLALLAFGIPAALVDSASERVPVAYAQHTSAEILVDRQFGAIVDNNRTSSITATFEVPGQIVPIPLSETSLHASDELVTSTISKLNSARTKLSLVTFWLPGAMLGCGLALLGAASWQGARNRLALKPSQSTRSTIEV